MADRKISELTNITGANLADADEFVVVDTSASETKAITWAELKEGLDTGTGFVRITGDTMTGNLSFGDNDKAIFGAGSDLQIFHDGANSYIKDSGTGNLRINAGELTLTNAADNQNRIVTTSDGTVYLYNGGSIKLATTNTGVDITGTVTADGLTVDGDIDLVGTQYVGRGSNLNALVLNASFGNALTSTADFEIVIDANGVDSDREFRVARNNSAFSTTENMMKITENGDISFYEDTGTTPKFFWDASAERLGIGTTSPQARIDSSDVSNFSVTYNDFTGDGLHIQSTGTSGSGAYAGGISFSRISSDNNSRAAGIAAVQTDTDADRVGLAFFTHPDATTSNDLAEAMRIDSSGNVGIGTSSPVSALDVTGTVTADGLTVDGGATFNLSSAQAVSIFRSPDFATLKIGEDANNNFELHESGNDFFIRETDTSVTKNRIKLSAGGDISFYEDTGVTPKFFWDASAESLGIGTSSPSAAGSGYGALDVRGAAGGGIRYGISSGFNMLTYATGTSVDFVTSAAGDIRFFNKAATGESMRIDSSGNVGIGTSSPAFSSGSGLRIERDTTATLRLQNTSSHGFEIRATISAAEFYSANSKPFTFETGGSERMRLDASGNLLVGKTAINTNVVGVEFKPAGQVLSTADGTNPLFLNRKTSDGEIVRIAKDGTTVGSIGTNSNGNFQLYGAEASHVGLQFGSPNIMPTNNSGALTDATAELGSSSYRFKDLYLSGGVYLGGTGAANKLDDYEEGTWTPFYGVDSGAFTTMTYSSASGTYTKVGNLVYFMGVISTSEVSLGTASGAIYIGGLPFTSSATSHAVVPHFARRWNLSTDATLLNGGIASGQSVFRISKMTMNSTSTTTTVQASEMLTGAGGFRNEYYFSGTYLTA